METLIISTPDYAYLAKAIAEQLGSAARYPVLVRKTFPDGEEHLQLTTQVQGAHVALIGGTQNAQNLVDLITLGAHVVKTGARRLSVIVPYFGYSTMERAKYPGEVVRAKSNATMLSAIPNPPEGKHFYLTDLHAAGITEYFEGGCHVQHLYAMPHILTAIQSVLNGPVVVGSADTGRVDWVESYAKELKTDLAVITKRRTDGSNVDLLAVGGRNVEGKAVVIYDDMIRSGNTTIKAIAAYKAAGADQIVVAASHLPLVSGDKSPIVEAIFSAGASDIITTNSLPHVADMQNWLRLHEPSFRFLPNKSHDGRLAYLQDATEAVKAIHVVDLTPLYVCVLNEG